MQHKQFDIQGKQSERSKKAISFAMFTRGSRFGILGEQKKHLQAVM